MADLSTKPYLIRAIYEWCADSGFTPYLNIKVDHNTRVPIEYVKNGEIVLSISQQATRNLTIGNDILQFSARFNGVSREIAVPIYAVQSIFARENGQGFFFDPESPPDEATSAAPAAPTGPTLQSVPGTNV
ncbi:MAG: ClpXP protease specificity-enhancing factor, partial [Betaproteobacteria bacterium]|nr:ClpXP protease specificity-enhancing factor [Betaproteobacteria bacterium]